MPESLSARVRAARLAVAAVFLVNGTVMATWVSRIPAIKHHLELSEGQLGLALLGLAVGALLSFPLAGPLIARFGSRPVLLLAGLALCVTLPLIPGMSSLALLTAVLAVLGACNGTMDVAMNAHAVEVEQRFHRPIMSSFHGMFSLGGLLGAGLGGGLAGRDVPPALHFAGVTGVLALLLLWIGPHLLPAPPSREAHGPVFALPTRALLGLGLIALCAFLIEGAMADWSAVYLRDTLGTSAAYAAVGYAAFSLTMTLTRFGGDALVARLGAARMVRAGGLLAALGVGGALLLGQPGAALGGFACVGVGMATIVPLVFSAAGRTPGMPSGTAIAAAATMGYSGFLAGPPLIGFLAEMVTLRGALGVVALLGLVIALLSGQVGRSAGGAARSAAVEPGYVREG